MSAYAFIVELNQRLKIASSKTLDLIVICALRTFGPRVGTNSV